MILVIDSGSTKADWEFKSMDQHLLLATMGFNPMFTGEEKIYAASAAALLEKGIETAKVQKIFFYGAGCWDISKKNVVRAAFQRLFPKAAIVVEHDLLGAAKATCFDDPGIACIIGTGSNSCHYDGEKIIDNVTNLGYLLGDEGSGSHLGKKLITAYYYRELPTALRKAFEERYSPDRMSILDKIYGKDIPNVFLASFTTFLGEYKHHFFVQKLLFESFSEFIERHVRKYKNHNALPIHFVGSVAYYFKETLETVLEERSMIPGRFIQKPIDSLIDYHFHQYKIGLNQ